MSFENAIAINICIAIGFGKPLPVYKLNDKDEPFGVQNYGLLRLFSKHI